MKPSWVRMCDGSLSSKSDTPHAFCYYWRHPLEIVWRHSLGVCVYWRHSQKWVCVVASLISLISLWRHRTLKNKCE